MRMMIGMMLSVFVMQSAVFAQEDLAREGLEYVEAADFVFYFPAGYEPVKEQGDYFYHRGNNVILATPYDYLTGQDLDQVLCDELARLFNDSADRKQMNASEAQGVTFTDEDGLRSCYYAYDMSSNNRKGRVEYNVYQRAGLPAYAVTAVYSANSPDQNVLYQALSAFIIKSGAQPSATTPSVLSDVLIDRSDPAYTVYYGIPANLPQDKRANVQAEAEKPDRELAPWEAFGQDADDYVTTGIVNNEYPEVDLSKGLLELMQTNPGTPFGVTWNGGIAYMYSDYQYVKKSYQRYLDDPAEYERTRPHDQQSDPVHPMNHFGPLLGW